MAGAATALLLVLLGGFHLLTLPAGFAWQTDAPAYLQHAENLRAGQPYAFQHAIPNREVALDPTAYPPGYPAVLALGQALGLDREALKLLNIAFLLLTLALWDVLLRPYLPLRARLVWVAAVGLSPPLWLEVPLLLPHLMFVALIAAVLVVVERGRRRSHAGDSATGSNEHTAANGRTPGARLWEAAPDPARLWGLAVLAVGLSGAAVATRSLGVVLGPVLLVQALRERRPLRVAGRSVVLGGALALALVLAIAARLPALLAESYGPLVEGDLVRHLPEMHLVVLRSLWTYAEIAARLWALPGGEVGGLLVLLGTLPLVAYGFVRQWRARSVLEVFTLGYLAALLPWTFGKFRYFIPLVPLYFFYLAVGIRALPRPWPRRATLALGVVLLASYGSSYLRMLPPDLPAASYEADLQATADYLSRMVAPGEIAAAHAARALGYIGAVPTLRTDPSFPLRGFPDPMLDRHQVRYAVWPKPHARNLMLAPPRVGTLPPCLAPVYENDTFVVARYDPEAACFPPEPGPAAP